MRRVEPGGQSVAFEARRGRASAGRLAYGLTSPRVEMDHHADLEPLAARLEQSGDYRVLRRVPEVS